jgi:hypothetical protein
MQEFTVGHWDFGLCIGLGNDWGLSSELEFLIHQPVSEF